MTPQFRRQPIGTLVQFPRRGRDNTGSQAEWLDQGVISKIEVATYVIVNKKGELFVRHFDEIVPID